MHSSDVNEWIEDYERSRPEVDRARSSLDRLALITRDEDDFAGHRQWGPPASMDSTLTRTLGTATRPGAPDGRRGRSPSLAVLFG